MPELAASANAVSILMPALEPAVAKAVRRAIHDERFDHEPDVVAEAERYVREELAHHAAHRRFNAVAVADTPSLRWPERGAERFYRWFAGRSLESQLAHAAAFETVAFAGARWSQRRLSEFFGADAEPAMAEMFVWHLAEEVEHASIAWDVMRSSGVSSRRFAAQALVVLVVLVVLTTVGAVLGVVASGRLWHPLAWLRLVGWAVGFAFTVLPMLAAACLPGHHPTDFAAPTAHRVWLERRAQDVAGSSSETDTTVPLTV